MHGRSLAGNVLYHTRQKRPMQYPQNIKTAYIAALMSRAQHLIEKRKRSNVTQSQMAHYCGVSIKTIQRFEAMRQESAYLCFAYEKVISAKSSPPDKQAQE